MKNEEFLSFQEEETKEGGRTQELVAQMQALAINVDQKKKKKPEKKKKVSGANENSVAGRTRGKIAEFMKAKGPIMRKPKVGVVYDNIMTLHQSHREEHPERPERIMAIYLNLIDKGIYDDLIKIDSD